MYDIQWFKLEKNIFCNRKIQLLLGLNDGDTYFRIWIQLLSLAVECGDGGRLIIGNNPISIKEFSKIMGKSSKKMSKILDRFLELEMLKKELADVVASATFPLQFDTNSVKDNAPLDLRIKSYDKAGNSTEYSVKADSSKSTQIGVESYFVNQESDKPQIIANSKDTHAFVKGSVYTGYVIDDDEIDSILISLINSKGEEKKLLDKN